MKVGIGQDSHRIDYSNPDKRLILAGVEFEANENNSVIQTTDRNNTWIIQTPQCFDRLVLLDMHEKYKDDDVTDDCSLLEKDGYKIKVISGDYSNIKITTREDLNIIKELYKFFI